MTRNDRGTILPLIAGFTVSALLLVLGAIDASAAFLAQRDLASVCDGAALAAAQSVSARAVYEAPGVSAALPLARGRSSRPCAPIRSATTPTTQEVWSWRRAWPTSAGLRPFA